MCLLILVLAKSVFKVIFVCENNQYAANNAVAVQHRNIDLAVHAASYGMPGFTIDGNDVLGVRDASRTAIDRARRGEAGGRDGNRHAGDRNGQRPCPWEDRAE